VSGQDVALELENLVMHFGPVQAVDGVSLSIRKGQVTVLVGESGSGKSTVGRCIVRLLEPTSGAVRVGGTDITNMSRRQLRRHRKGVSIVFQDPAGSLDPRMLVGDVIGEPLRLQAACLDGTGRRGSTASSAGSDCAARWPSATPTSCPAGSANG